MFLFTTPSAPDQTPARAMSPGLPHRSALSAAAQATGVSFDYLVETARRESGFKVQAQAATSSARGLFQFTDQTWLRIIRSEGANVGLAQAAQAITIDGTGRASVADAGMRARILALRDDPALSSRLAAALAQQNSAALAGHLGRTPSNGELYLAHFLGASGAARLIQLRERSPGVAAAQAFPQAAAANRSVFYTPAGAARSAGEVYGRLVSGYEGAASSQVAQAPKTRDARPFVSLFRTGNDTSSLHQAAALWREAGRSGVVGQPLNLNAFRMRSPTA